MIPLHLSLNVRGGVVVGGGGCLCHIPPTTPPLILSHIYDTLTFKFECQGWGGGGGGVFVSHTPPPPLAHPWHLSHIYDTLTFKFKCQGWGGGGGCLCHIPPSPTTTPPLTLKLKCQGWGGGGGYIKMGKKFYRFKTEGWAQDVGCADIKNCGLTF